MSCPSKHIGRFEARSQFSTWLTKIAIYEGCGTVASGNAARLYSSMNHPEDVMASTERSPEEQAFHSEMKSLLESAIESLPLDYRTVFTMRDIEGMSTTETAECLD